MAGQVIELLPRTNFDFTFLGNSESQMRVLVGKIPTAQWTKGKLMVRVHNTSIPESSTSKIDVILALDASTSQDPEHTFVQSTPITNGTVSVTEAAEEGEVLVSSDIDGGLGYMLAMAVHGQMAPTADKLQAELSVVLVLKDS